MFADLVRACVPDYQLPPLGVGYQSVLALRPPPFGSSLSSNETLADDPNLAFLDYVDMSLRTMTDARATRSVVLLDYRHWVTSVAVS